MKRTYLAPETISIELQTQQLMAGSMPYGGTTDEKEGNLARQHRGNRKGNGFDDEEYMDEEELDGGYESPYEGF